MTPTQKELQEMARAARTLLNIQQELLDTVAVPHLLPEYVSLLRLDSDHLRTITSFDSGGMVMTDFVSGMPSGSHECLWQLFCSGPVRDGDLVCKSSRKWLVENGFAEQSSGYNFLTRDGVDMAVTVGMDRRKDCEGAHS